MIAQLELEVHFYRQDEVSILLESTLSGDEEKFAERFLFCLYAIRMMFSLGSGEVSASLASALYNTSYDALLMLAADKRFSDVRLTPYTGRLGAMHFRASLYIEDADIRFFLEPIGFSVLGRDVNYYAPVSVMALLTFLAWLRKENATYLVTLAKAAELCGSYCLSEVITLDNQNRLAYSIAKQSEYYEREETA